MKLARWTLMLLLFGGVITFASQITHAQDYAIEEVEIVGYDEDGDPIAADEAACAEAVASAGVAAGVVLLGGPTAWVFIRRRRRAKK